jgi:hypothetical protein
MAKTFNDAIDGEPCDISLAIFQKCKTGFGGADLRDGGGKRTRQARPAGNRDLHVGMTGGDQIHQIIFQ